MNQKDYSKEEIEAFLMEIKPLILEIVDDDTHDDNPQHARATVIAGIITRHFYESLTGRTIEQEKTELFAQLSKQAKLYTQEAAND